MDKIVLDDVGTTNTLSKINENNAKLELHLNDKVLYRERVVGTDNEMKTDLDMNSNRIYNLVSPASNTEPVRLQDLKDWNGTSEVPATADEVSFRGYLPVVATNVQDAIEDVIDLVNNIDIPSDIKPTKITNLPNFTLNASTPDSRYPIATTSPDGWNLIPSSKIVEFELVLNNYLQANPEGHIAILARCDTSFIATNLSGQGMLFGKTVGDAGNSASFFPTTVIETWRNPNAAPNRWIYPDTDGSPGQPLVDGGRYKVSLTTTRHEGGQSTIGYKRYKWNTSWNAWDLEVDTGDVLDNNTTADLTKDGLAFGFVASSNLVTWSVPITNVKVTWCAPIPARTDTRALFPRFGGAIRGNVIHQGNVTYGSKNIYVASTGAVGTWTKTLDAVAGNDTKVLVTPNKTSGVAAMLLANSNTPTNSSYLSLGMYPTYASIHCGKEGSATAASEIRFSVDGVTSRALIAKSSGVYAPQATQPLGINTGILASVYNIGGTNATTFSNSSAFDMEQLCTVGQVTSFLTAGSVFSNAQADRLEGLFRPLYAILSVAVASARNKGTM